MDLSRLTSFIACLLRIFGGAFRSRVYLKEGAIWRVFTLIADTQHSSSEGRIGQPIFDLNIKGGDHIAHDGVEATKCDEFDDARIAVDLDEPPLHARRD
jgi:hypothetical protein